ncbi:MAG: type II toxin-antitoxin system VapC family toxin [Verrucomicrobiales bacterium]
MILLDTCTLLWLALEPERLSPQARTLLDDPAQLVWLSAISAFEVGQKHAKGKLELSIMPEEWIARAIQSHQLKPLDLDIRSAARAATLPPLHNDPFDRLLIATAQQHRLTLLTPDEKIRAYPDLQTAW